ncbi:MAG: homocysteine S-methyltransferase family protein, partial [Actinomycetota bacterium]
MRYEDWSALSDRILIKGIPELRVSTYDMKPFLDTVRERVVIYDGAMGTQIQQRNPSLDDFWGKENCSEVLVLSRPDIIKDIHAAYFKAGADVVETNTFGASSI